MVYLFISLLYVSKDIKKEPTKLIDSKVKQQCKTQGGQTEYKVQKSKEEEVGKI